MVSRTWQLAHALASAYNTTVPKVRPGDRATTPNQANRADAAIAARAAVLKDEYLEAEGAVSFRVADARGCSYLVLVVPSPDRSVLVQQPLECSHADCANQTTSVVRIWLQPEADSRPDRTLPLCDHHTLEQELAATAPHSAVRILRVDPA